MVVRCSVVHEREGVPEDEMASEGVTIYLSADCLPCAHHGIVRFDGAGPSRGAATTYTTPEISLAAVLPSTAAAVALSRPSLVIAYSGARPTEGGTFADSPSGTAVLPLGPPHVRAAMFAPGPGPGTAWVLREPPVVVSCPAVLATRSGVRVRTGTARVTLTHMRCSATAMRVLRSWEGPLRPDAPLGARYGRHPEQWTPPEADPIVGGPLIQRALAEYAAASAAAAAPVDGARWCPLRADEQEGEGPAPGWVPDDEVAPGTRMDGLPLDVGDAAVCGLHWGPLPDVSPGALARAANRCALRLGFAPGEALSASQSIRLAAQVLSEPAQVCPYILDTVAVARLPGNGPAKLGRESYENVRPGPGDCEDGSAWILRIMRAVRHHARRPRGKWATQMRALHSELWRGLRLLTLHHVAVVAFCVIGSESGGKVAGGAGGGVAGAEEEEAEEGPAQRGGHATVLAIPCAWWWRALRVGLARRDGGNAKAYGKPVDPVHPEPRRIGAGAVIMMESTGGLLAGNDPRGGESPVHSDAMDVLLDASPALDASVYNMRANWASPNRERDHVSFFRTVVRLATDYHASRCVGATASDAYQFELRSAPLAAGLPWTRGAWIEYVLRPPKRLADDVLGDADPYYAAWLGENSPGTFALAPIPGPSAALLEHTRRVMSLARPVPCSMAEDGVTDGRRGRELLRRALAHVGAIARAVDEHARGAPAPGSAVVHAHFYVLASSVIARGPPSQPWLVAPAWQRGKCVREWIGVEALASVEVGIYCEGITPTLRVSFAMRA